MRQYNSPQYQGDERYGFICIEVLPFLVGRLWDINARNIIRSLRPSSVRVSTDGAVNCDGRCWRVTVYVCDGFIQKIEQEVEVDLVGWDYGADASSYLRRR